MNIKSVKNKFLTYLNFFIFLSILTFINFDYKDVVKGERRELNPRIMEPQPIALTIWLRPPMLTQYNTKILLI